MADSKAAAIESLNKYRTLANALAYSHMNHKHREAQLTILIKLVELRIDNCTPSDYRGTLEGMLVPLRYALHSDSLTHSSVKDALHLAVTVVEQGINDAEHSILYRAGESINAWGMTE